MVHLEPAHLAEQARSEWQSRPPVARLTHASHHVQHRVKAGSQTPAGEVIRLGSQAAMPEPQLIEQPVQSVAFALEGGQILIDERFSGARKPPPHSRLHIPEQQLVALLLTQRTKLTLMSLIEITRDHRNCEAAE